MQDIEYYQVNPLQAQVQAQVQDRDLNQAKSGSFKIFLRIHFKKIRPCPMEGTEGREPPGDPKARGLKGLRYLFGLFCLVDHDGRWRRPVCLLLLWVFFWVSLDHCRMACRSRRACGWAGRRQWGVMWFQCACLLAAWVWRSDPYHVLAWRGGWAADVMWCEVEGLTRNLKC